MAAFTILGLSGSLRQASLNTAALRAAQELAPDGITITLGDISQIPLYNDDIRIAGQPPPAVLSLAQEIAAAEAVMIATPEYNYSIPGVLKNALDWVSRLPDQPFRNKPVAIMGVSPSPVGTARCQYDLRKVFVYLDAHVLNKPEVMISNSATRFDAAGRLTDETSRKIVAMQIVALRDWARDLRR